MPNTTGSPSVTDGTCVSNTESTHPADLDFEAMLDREWLITNGRGGYASGTMAGVGTRRYHGLLVAAARPPLERWLLLSSMLERVVVSGHAQELGCFEFDGCFHPQGSQHLSDFAVSNNTELPWVRFVYTYDDVRLTKLVTLPHGTDEVSIRYRLEGPSGAPVSLGLCPFLAMRDFHGSTHAFDGGYTVGQVDGFVTVDAFETGPRLWLGVHKCLQDGAVAFEHQPNFWTGFVHRQESVRGQDDHEDLFVPGWFRTAGTGQIDLEFRAVADFSSDSSAMPSSTTPQTVDDVPEMPLQTVSDRLCEAASAFVVTRRGADETDLTTILAGYHWFGDWGRDTFIALPGLLLETGRFAEARQVLEVFASAQRDGLIPNRFSDYGDGCDYNSVDASLWFVHAADAYLQASGDPTAWSDVLASACTGVVEGFLAGAHFNIHATDDGLIACGDESTQLTWMDAKCGNVVFTPRHGKPVEINALWHHALHVLAERTRSDDPERAKRYEQLAHKVGQAFVETFWNAAGGYLFDVVRDDWSDPAVRPNQIFAVSLPHSPLNADQQRSVLETVENRLLTPFGLRSLCTKHPSYSGRYEGDAFGRDSVYHQGTVWGWLIGPFVEAYLRVHDFSGTAKAKTRERLVPLIDHLDQAGIGSVNEIFDGDPPYTPRGCIAQAWSVSELLRAWRLSEPDAD